MARASACPTDCTENYFAGTNVGLRATPSTAVFSGGCTGTMPRRVDSSRYAESGCAAGHHRHRAATAAATPAATPTPTLAATPTPHPRRRPRR